jgi:class 3 adenylate cyclase/CheY-like chemotaxis protein
MRILVVDDEAAIRDICARGFRQAGYECMTAESGEAALPRLHEAWDIILTDLAMPGSVNGTELLRRARAAGTADVILMTARPELDTAIESMQGGARDYLIKPFTVSGLLSTVKRCLEKRRLTLELAHEKAVRADIERTQAEMARIQMVKDTFGLFVAPEVANYVLTFPHGQWETGVHKKVTVLFADVRKFTPFAGSISPKVAVENLNEIFSHLVPAIQREGGILNKFLGDGILALFGAPLDMEGHERAAARAALRAMMAVEHLALSRLSRGLQPLRIGIGVNTGEVVAGCVGAKDRAEYSVIGHTVNLAARLNAAAQPGQILLGSDTAKALSGYFHCRMVGPIKLSGIADPGDIWELVGESTSAALLR